MSNQACGQWAVGGAERATAGRELCRINPDLMRVSLHDYRTDPRLAQRDGVNLAHTELTALFRRLDSPDLEVDFHDFMRLCTDLGYARSVLAYADCVISNVGPHAHYYFYLRDKLDLSFRIIRDVRTALWSSYLLQELLCAPYLRGCDTILFPSAYARALFKAVYPHLAAGPSAVCYPLAHGFPARRTQTTRSALNRGSITLGYIGRLSEDKNFPQLIDLLIRLERQHPGRFRLVACGEVYSPSCNPGALAERVSRETSRRDAFEYLAPVAHSRVWEIYDRFDVFLFPSTSNIETLGRVLVEASYCGVPVIAASHAAVPELLPPKARVPVLYDYNRKLSTHFGQPLGCVDLRRLVELLEAGDFVENVCFQSYQAHAEMLLDLVSNHKSTAELASPRLGPEQRAFVDRVRVEEIPAPPGRDVANEIVENLLEWFRDLQTKSADGRPTRAKELLEISRHPARTESFLDKSAKTRGDFTNVGGLDLELCHVVGFYPQFQLAQR